MRRLLPGLLLSMILTGKLLGQTDTASINALNQQAWNLKFSNPDSSRLLAKLALTTSIELGFVRGSADAMKNLGVLMHLRGNLDSAYYYADEAATRFVKIRDKKGQASSLNLKGVIHYSRGQYPQALALYIDVAGLYETLGDKSGLARVYNNIGNTLYKQEEDDRALEYYQMAVAIHRAQQNIEGQMEALSNIGMVQMEQQRYREALANYAEAETFASSAGNKRLQGNIWQNMAICFRYQGDHDAAQRYYAKSLEIKRQLSDADGICSSLTGLAIIAKQSGQFRAALELIDEAVKTAEDAELLDRLSNAYQIKYEVYTAMGDGARAFESFRQFTATKDSLFSIEKSRQLSELQVKYETEKKEKEIVILKTEADLQAAMKNRAILIAVALALILTLAFYGFRLRNKLYKARNEKLLYENRLREQENLRLAEELRAEGEINRIQSEKHALEIDYKNRELTSAALYAVQKNEILLDLKEKLEELNEEKTSPVKPLIRMIDSNLNVSQDWENTKLHFERVHPDFFDRLLEKYPDLTQTELKHIAYMKINLSGKEIARLLNIGIKAIQMSRYRIKKKIGLPEAVNLLEFIQNF